eukprot:3635641-Pyramimonas_sp.AAC.1
MHSAAVNRILGHARERLQAPAEKAERPAVARGLVGHLAHRDGRRSLSELSYAGRAGGRARLLDAFQDGAGLAVLQKASGHRQ